MPEPNLEEEETQTRSSRVTSETLLAAILAILVDERESGALHRDRQQRIEVLLADAGLAPGAIARVLNKKVNTIHVTLRREREKRARSASGSERKMGSANTN